MKKKILVVFSLSLCLVFVAQAVSAYVTIGYKLIGGVEGRKFTVPFNANYTYGGTTKDYGPLIRAGVADWNASVDPGFWPWDDKTDVDYTETTNYSESQLDFYVYEYGNTGWRGFAEYFESSGTQIKPGEYPDKDYHWNKAKMNVNYLHSDTNARIQATAAHEMGHTLGLKHSNKTETEAVMYSPATTNRATTVQSDDVNGVRAIY